MFQVYENDEFPQYLCSHCFFKLEEAAKIIKMSQNSHDAVKKYLLESMEQEEMPIEEIDEIPEEMFQIEDEEEIETSTANIKLEISEVLEFYCELCGTQFLDEPEFNNHLKMCCVVNQDEEESSTFFQCTNCQQTFQHDENFKNHNCFIAYKTCDLCNLNFESLEKFLSHLKAQHFFGDFYICEEKGCKETVSDEMTAYVHLLSHKTDRKFSLKFPKKF